MAKNYRGTLCRLDGEGREHHDVTGEQIIRLKAMGVHLGGGKKCVIKGLASEGI